MNDKSARKKLIVKMEGNLTKLILFEKFADVFPSFFSFFRYDFNFWNAAKINEKKKIACVPQDEIYLVIQTNPLMKERRDRREGDKWT